MSRVRVAEARVLSGSLQKRPAETRRHCGTSAARECATRTLIRRTPPRVSRLEIELLEHVDACSRSGEPAIVFVHRESAIGEPNDLGS